MAILTKAQLQAANSSSFPNNNSQAITPQILRDYNSSVIDTLVDSLDTGSFARTDLTNDFSATNNFTSISASSFVSASAFIGDGSKLTNITASVALPILDEGVLQGYATSMNFTGSNITAVVTAGTAVVNVNTSDLITTSSFNSFTSSINSFTASQVTKDSTLATYTASVDTKFTAVGSSTASLNAFTSSQETKNSTLATYTASVDTKFSTIGGLSASWDNTRLDLYTASQDTKNSTLASYTGSNDTKWSTLGTQSGSWITESETGSFITETESGSFLITASVNLNTITFTKGNNTTFAITVNTGSGGGGTADLTSLNAFTASQETKDTTLASVTSSLNTSASLALVTASFSGNTLTFTKGNGTTFGVVIPDVSGSTGNFATTGSNVFVGNQTITGSLFISGNINMVNGADLVTHHVKAAGSNGLELQTSNGTNIVQMGAGGGTQAAFVGAVTANSLSASTINGLGDPLAFSTSVDSRLDGLEASTASLFTSTSLSLTTASFSGNTLTFTKGNGTTFGVVIPDVSGSTINTGSFITTGSASTGSQTIFGDFKFDTTYTGSRAYNSQGGGSNIVYIDYGDAYGNADFTYWQSLNFVGVTVNGTGVTNATVTSVGFGTYVEANLSSGTVTNGASYTFTGPLLQTIDITGSLAVKQNVTVTTVNGTSTMNDGGFSANTTTFGGTLNPGIIQLRNINNNDIFQFAASSSAMYNGGGQWPGPQIATYQNDIGDATIIGFQTDTTWTDGRVTILRPLIAQSGSVITGNTTISGSLILSSSNAVELQVIGNSVFTGSANGNVVALSITSNTASMDLSRGNYFTLTLADTATTHISASNVQPGVSATLVITTGTNSSASLAPTMLQPSGSAYSATNGSAKKDVLSIVAVASGVPFVVSTKNMI